MTEGGPQHQSSDPRQQAAPHEEPRTDDATQLRSAQPAFDEASDQDASRAEDSRHSSPPQSGSSISAGQQRARPPVVDNEPTVISKRPPVSEAASAALSTPVEMGLALEGQRLGHFLLEEFVGGGGMGAVFRAVDTLLNRTVAVKVLSQRQSQDEETVRRFKQEAQSAARLDHDNIARAYFVGEHEGWHFIVFEFIEGTNIRDLVEEQGPLEIDDAIAYTLQTAEALAHASERDVVHRDIKPSNILITPLGRAKLVDMGLARLQQVEASGDDLTASGVTLGTFDYISPEQARDPRSADVRSDLYSLGCSLYYMLTGRPPFPGGTVLQKLLSHTSDTPPDPRALRPDLPESLVLILNKLLAKKPEARYQDPRELIGALLLLAEELGLPVATRGGTVWLSSSRKAEASWRRHLPWAMSLVALLAAVLILDMRWSHSSQEMAELPEYIVPAQAAPVSLPRTPEPLPNSPESTPPAAPAATTSGETAPGGATTPPGTPAAPPNSPPATSPATPPIDASPPGGELQTAVSPVLSGRPEDTGGLVTEFPGSSVGPLRPDAAGPGLGPPAATGAIRQAGMGPTGDAPGRRQESPGGEFYDPYQIQTLVVQPGGSGSLDSVTSVVASLEEACIMLRTMPNVTVIELEYDGVLEEPAISIGTQPGRHVTIRAATGFRPEVLFRPAGADPVSNPRTMLEITGGSFKLEGLAIAMEVPQLPAEGWALIGLEEAGEFEVVRCRFTIRNTRGDRAAYAANVAFFEMLGRDRLQLMTTEIEGPRPPLVLDIEDAILRGEAALVRASAAQPLRITWNNGLFVTTERLLQIQGASRAPRAGEEVQLELSHLTAIVDKGLCLATTEESHSYQLPLDVSADDCVFVTPPAVPLFAQQGVLAVDAAQELLRYDGRRNFYDGSDLFWKIDVAARDSGLAYDFADWVEYWGQAERRPARQAVRWAEPAAAALPVSEHLPSNYVLSDAPLPRGVAHDPRQSNAGFDTRQIATQPMAPAPLPMPVTPPVTMPRESEESTGTGSPREEPPASPPVAPRGSASG